MKIYTFKDLQHYLLDDWIMDEIKSAEKREQDDYLKEARTNVWLKTMDNKRMIYADVYGDLLKFNTVNDVKKKVLDIGGGINSLTKSIAKNTDYTLIDYMAHGGAKCAENEADFFGYYFVNGDWYDTTLKNDYYDFVIANDIFPDVDMRLELFLNRFLPKCKELRLIVTWYNAPRFYVTQRVDDTEMLTFLSWDGEITSMKLKKYLAFMIDTSEEELESIPTCKDSVYRNGRQVAYIRFKGGRHV